MKKFIISLSLCGVLCGALVGCAGQSTAQSESSASQALATPTVAPEATATPEPTATLTPEEEAALQWQSQIVVNIDLTQLHEYDVYTAVNTIMQDPDAYVGQIIKMTGTFDIYYDEESGNVYTSVFVMDETLCCAEGLTFTLASALTYPDDYPEDGAQVTVVGEFEIYDRFEAYNIIYTQLKSAFFVTTSD